MGALAYIQLAAQIVYYGVVWFHTTASGVGTLYTTDMVLWVEVYIVFIPLLHA